MRRSIKKNGRNLIRPRKSSGKDEKELQLEYAVDYGINFKERIITLVGDVDSDMFQCLDAALSLLESESRKAVTIRLNSGGGYVYDALAIVGRFKRSNCHITVEGYGCVMSAATLILAAGNKRKLSKYSWVMVHSASYEVDGKHQDVKSFVKQQEKEEISWVKWMAELTNQDEHFWKEKHIGQDSYMSAQESLSSGLIDEII